MNNGLVLFQHAGSGNHGCEAIVRGIAAGLSEGTPAQQERQPLFRLISVNTGEDERYLPSDFCRVEEERRIERHFFPHLFWYVWRKATGDRESFQRYRFPMLRGRGCPALAVSIGGDNYCYPDMVPDLLLADSMLWRAGAATTLVGCSVEPEMLEKSPELVRDMLGHRMIIARESISHDALAQAGVDPERLMLLPDPAFAMQEERLPLPEGFIPESTVGLNVSPLIEQYRESGQSALDAFMALTEHILDTTDFRIALIPHVVWASSNDLVPLKKILERYGESGRITLIGDAPAPVLKGFITRCRFFVGARTHATIAAYSGLVPTLVVGYSVKSKGIARDLFGSEDGYVIPVRDLDGKKLIEAFERLRAQEDTQRRILAEKIPSVKQRAMENGRLVMRLYDSLSGRKA